jgi:hypothetical protein
MPRKDRGAARTATRTAQDAPQDQGAVPLVQDQDQDQEKARIDLPQEMPPSVGAPVPEVKASPAPKPAPQPEPEEEEDELEEEDEEEDGEGLEDADGEEADGEEADGEEADGEDPGDELGLDDPASPPGEPAKRGRGRPRINPDHPVRKERPTDPGFSKLQDTARAIGARRDQIKVWAEAGQIPGIRYHNNGVIVPNSWIDSVLDGSIMAPDGISRTGTPKKKEKEQMKTAAAGSGRNQEVLNKLQGLYGTDADLKVELSRRGPAGYAYLQDMPHPPSKAELQGMFPEGGDFQLRIFRSGKVVDEVSGVIVDSIDGTPYSPSQAYAPNAGGFRRPVPGRTGFPGRPGFDPDGPPGLRSGGGDDGVGYLARKAADFAFDSMGKRNGGNGTDTAAVLQTVTEQTRHQVDSLAQSLEAERNRNQQREVEQSRTRKEEREEAEARRREEKEELEEQIAAQREEFENAKKIELEKLKMEHEQTATREREYLDRMRTAEQERTKSMIEAQNQFFTQMRELDKKRDEITRESHKESIAMQEKLMLAQRDSIEEQRRANDRMFEVQMGHLADMKNSGEPLALIASALGKGLEKIGPMIQSRMAGVNPGFAGMSVQPRAAVTTEGSPQSTGGDAMNLMQKIKSQPMFAEELEAIADKVKKKVHPAFTVNKLLGMMQYDPSISIILDYVVSADVRDVAKGVRLSADAVQTLNGKEAAEWWTLFQSLLQKTMVASIEQAPPPPEAPPAPPANPGQGPSLNQGL